MAKIRGITIEFSADSRPLEKALTHINKESRNLGRQLRDVNKLLRFEPKNVELMAQKQSILTKRINESNDKLKALKEIQRDMDLNGVDKNSEQYQALRREITDTESLMKTYKEQLKQVNAEIENNTNKNKLLEAKIKDMGKVLEGVGKKFKDVGKKISTVGADMSLKLTTPIVGLGTVSVKAFSEAETAWASYSATSNKSGQELINIQKKAIETAKDTAYSTKEVGEMMEYMALAGWKPEESLGQLDSMLKFVTASQLEAGQATDMVTDYLTAFGMGIDDTERLMNVMLRTQSVTNTDVEQLGNAYKNTAATAGAFGYSIEDTSVALGLLANASDKSLRSGTHLKGIMTQLGTASGDSKKALDDLGVSVFNADGSSKPFMETINNLRESFKDLTAEEKINYAERIVGKGNVNAFMTLMDASTESVEEATEAINGNDDALARMSETMEDTNEHKIKKMKKELNEMFRVLGEKLIPVFQDVIEKIGEWATKFTELDDETIEQIVKIGLLIAAVGPLLVIFGKVLDGIGSILETGGSLLNGIGSVVGVLGGPLTIALGVAVAAGVLLWKNWDTVKEMAQNLWETLTNVFSGIYDSVKEFFEPIGEFFVTTWEEIKLVTETVWNSLTEFFSITWEIITDIFSFAFELIKSIVESAFAIIEVLIRTPLEIIKAIFQTIWNYIGEYTIEVWEGIKETISRIVNSVSEIVSNIWNSLSDTVGKIWSNISSITGEVWENIKTKVTNVANAVKETVTNIWNNLKTIVDNIWNAIKSSITGPLDQAKTTATTLVNSMKEGVTNSFNGIKTSATNIFNSVRDAIVNPINRAKELVEKALGGIKGFFSNLRLKFPKIEMPKLPRFSLVGKFSLKPPSVPKLSVSWNREGGIFKQPTILPSLAGYQGVAEPSTGGEAIMPLNKLPQLMTEAMDKSRSFNQQPVIHNIFIVDGKQIAYEVAPAVDKELGKMENRNIRKRGR